jgi:hypothetical protein
MNPLDRLAAKFADLNERVSREHRRPMIRETLDQMVLNGELGYDPETGEYINLMAPGEDEGGE